MARQYELLLLETIENLGLVGDVVKVRPGYARNYLLPNEMAEAPTPEKIESLKEARAKAEAEVSKQRAQREAIITRLNGVTITLIRPCNDQGVLYGAVTQRDISDKLVTEGYGVDMRAVRLTNPMRRIGSQHVTIQFGRDLIAEITVEVKPDRIIELETPGHAKHHEAEAKNKGGEGDRDDEDGDDTGSKEPSTERSTDDESKSDRATKSARKSSKKPAAE
ncbi:MAG: 50S ribosomal protein L9 [Phycisphaerales bacterium]|nr:50S ribosomal protein L9 [Phycisphaerales bacterium]